MIKYLNSANFNRTINNHEVVLVDFSADWCSPCNLMVTTIESLSKEFNDKAVISKINIDTNPELANAYGIRSLPSFVYFQNGKVVDAQVGLQTKTSIREKIKNLLN